MVLGRHQSTSAGVRHDPKAFGICRLRQLAIAQLAKLAYITFIRTELGMSGSGGRKGSGRRPSQAVKTPLRQNRTETSHSMPNTRLELEATSRLPDPSFLLLTVWPKWPML